MECKRLSFTDYKVDVSYEVDEYTGCYMIHDVELVVSKDGMSILSLLNDIDRYYTDCNNKRCDYFDKIRDMLDTDYGTKKLITNL